MVRTIRCLSWAVVAGGMLGVVTQAQAQAGAMQPAMLSVICERVKPGMSLAHDKHEEAWARASESVQGFATSFAIQSMTGPQESCWLTRVANFEALGQNNERYASSTRYSAALPTLLGEDGKYVSDVRAYIAMLRTDLSEGASPTLAERRFTTWGEWRVRPGNGAIFAGALKAYVAAAKRAGNNPAFRVYQVMHGAPGETYWLFTSQATMAGFDAMMSSDPKTEAAFTADDLKVFEEFFTKVMSMNSNLWSYNAAQSSLSADDRATDPFWKRKPNVAVKKQP